MRLLERGKLFAARWLYRWQTSSGILGAVFQALTFAGVFTILLGPILGPLGIGYSTTLLLLVSFVAALFFGFGFVLDRIVRFWTAQVEVGTVRNPYLIDRLYQKELLTMSNQHLPVLRALLSLTSDTRVAAELATAIMRLEETARNKRWSIRPGEEVYEDSA